jgi:hypothetical protein
MAEELEGLIDSENGLTSRRILIEQQIYRRELKQIFAHCWSFSPTAGSQSRGFLRHLYGRRSGRGRARQRKSGSRYPQYLLLSRKRTAPHQKGGDAVCAPAHITAGRTVTTGGSLAYLIMNWTGNAAASSQWPNRTATRDSCLLPSVPRRRRSPSILEK